jgi:mono/diheme cytochrome c family protein
MKNKLLKAGLVLFGFVVFIIATAAATVEVRHDRTFDVAEVDVVASTDPDVIERGAYLAYGPAHCAYCHTTEDKHARLDAGERVPLSGGYVFDIGIAKLPTPNLTPDKETGIGDLSDGKLARMLRHNVRSNGVAAVPIMEFENLSEEDLVAVLSYLRSQEPVRNEVPPRELRLVGKAISAFLLKPTGPTGTPPLTSPASGATVERGAYLVNNVAACAGCHTKRSHMDGSYLAPKLSGGTPMEGEGGKLYTPPNLTPHEGTGHIVQWTEDQFVHRFRAGVVNQGTHMPWQAYARMSDDDLRAIFRYLRTVEPVENAVGPMVADE